MSLRSVFLSAAVLVGTLGLIAGYAFSAPADSKSADAKKKRMDDLIKRGEYLVGFGGCNDCHTPWIFDRALGAPRPDMTRMLSGHPTDGPDPAGKYTAPDIAVIGPDFTSFNLPFGTVYAFNLTPDKETGLGSWTEGMFIRAMRTGRHMGGGKDARPILPPMPWEDVNRLNDRDLRAVFAYLQSIPPIKNAVPNPKVSPEVLNQLSQALERGEEMEKKETPKPKAAP